MKKLLLSLKGEYLKCIIYGIKKYEYRHRFTNEETLCYLYLSGKPKCIIGILKLGKPIKLVKEKDNIKDKNVLNRVEDYINKKDINAIPILELSLFDKPLYLNKIRKRFKGFMPPQMYYVLDNNKPLKDYLSDFKANNVVIKHKHDKIYYEDLCVSITEMKNTAKYRELDLINKDKYDYLSIK